MQTEWPAWREGHLPAPLLRHFLSGERFYRGASLVVQQHVEHQLLFLRARPRCKADSLSERQLEVAVLVAQGQSHKAVAQRLGLAPATVRNHLQAIYDKLEVGKVAGLVDALRQAGAL
jgi:DNA-binding NarL/FixJ family response regulator